MGVGVPDGEGSADGKGAVVQGEAPEDGLALAQQCAVPFVPVHPSASPPRNLVDTIAVSGDVVEVPYHCGTAMVAEYLVEGRLHWEVRHVCPDGEVLECGRDRLPDGWRVVVLARGGTFRVRFPAGDRVAVMRVLRRRGVAVGGLNVVLAQGLTGTEAEMESLWGQFAGAGVAVVVERVAGAG